jgi:hypothetical protein
MWLHAPVDRKALARDRFPRVRGDEDGQRPDAGRINPVLEEILTWKGRREFGEIRVAKIHELMGNRNAASTTFDIQRQQRQRQGRRAATTQWPTPPSDLQQLAVSKKKAGP